MLHSKDIKANSESYELKMFYELTCIFAVDCNDVYTTEVNKFRDFIPFQRKERINLCNGVNSKKLKGFSFDDYFLGVYAIESKYIKSRETFIELIGNYLSPCKWSTSRYKFSQPKDVFIERVLMANFEHPITCNEEYYMENPHELENDLGFKLKETDFNIEDLITL